MKFVRRFEILIWKIENIVIQVQYCDGTRQRHPKKMNSEPTQTSK